MSESRSIPSNKFLNLIANLNVGSPIAEDDVLLHEARVETSFFSEILWDRVDIIKGTKGSGKTALFRIFTDFLESWMLEKQNVVILKGVEVSGDPVFLRFRPQFDNLDEVDFQSFWRIYFLSRGHVNKCAKRSQAATSQARSMTRTPFTNVAPW